MAVFDDKSRYVSVERYVVQDHRGRQVTVLAVPAAPDEQRRGYHVLRQGQRLRYHRLFMLDHRSLSLPLSR